MICGKCNLDQSWCCCSWTENGEEEFQRRLRLCVQYALDEKKLARTAVVHALLLRAMQVNLNRLLTGDDEDPN